MNIRDVLISALDDLAAAIITAPSVVVGSQASASSSRAAVNPQKAHALRNGATRVASGVATRAEIDQLIAASNIPGDISAVRLAIAHAYQALQASDLP